MEYKTLEYEASRERSCYTPGRVYLVTQRVSKDSRLIEGDFLLCIRKSGDSHYDFIRIERTGETQDSFNNLPLETLSVYFEVKTKHSAYGGMPEAFPSMTTLPDFVLVHALYSGQLLLPMLEVLNEREVLRLRKIRELDKAKAALMFESEGHLGERK